MYDILIYLTNLSFREEILELFRGTKYLCHEATSAEEVLDTCKQDFIDLILLWPAKQEVVEDLLTLLNLHDLGYIPVLAVIEKKADLLSIIRHPIADFLLIPLPKKEFFEILEQNVHSIDAHSRTLQGQFWRGNVEEFDLIDLIQMVEANRKDAILSMSYHDHLGQVFFSKGKLVRATLRDLETLPAIKKLAALEKGTFQIQFTRVDLMDGIELNNRELLSELIRYNAELKEKYENLPGVQEELQSSGKNSEMELDTVHEGLLYLCRHGSTIHDLMVSMNERNTEILDKLVMLFDEQLIVRQQDYELMERLAEENRGLNRFIHTFTRFFKKEKQEQLSVEKPEKTAKTPGIDAPRVAFQAPQMEADVVHQIQIKLKEF